MCEVLWARTDARQDVRPGTDVCLEHKRSLSHALCHPVTPTGRCSLLYFALKQLFSVTLAEEVNTLLLFSAIVTQSWHPNIVQSEIPSDPLITAGFAWTNHWPARRDDNIVQAYKKWHIYSLLRVHVCHILPTLSSFLQLILSGLPSTPAAFDCTEAKRRPSELPLLENAKSYQTASSLRGTPKRPY